MIKLGFLGGGVDSIAGNVHLVASQMDQKFLVVGGVFSNDKNRSKQSAKHWHIKAFDNISAMCKEVDLVVVLTPTPLHFENIKELLHHNVGIIVDKPLVATTAEADALQKQINNKFIVVTHNYSGYPLVREIRALIENNLIGSAKKVVINMYQESFFKPMKPGYPQQWRLKDGEIPTIYLDLGVHVHHLFEFLFHNTLEPLYTHEEKFSQYSVVDDVEIVSKAEDTLVKFGISKVMLGNTNPLCIEVYGDKAGIKWTQESAEELLLTYSDGKKEILTRSHCYFEANKKRYNRMAPGHPSGFIEAFANLYADIYESFMEFKEKRNFTNQFVYDWKYSIESLQFFKKAREC